MLDIGNELNEIDGGYDPRLESNKEVQYYDSSLMSKDEQSALDEELAKRLQTEELNPNTHTLSLDEIKNDAYHDSTMQKSAFDVVDYRLRQDAKRADQLRDQKIKQQEEILERQKRELAQLSRMPSAPSMLVPKPTSLRNYIDPNDGLSLRLYNWGSTLIPDWYSYQERLQAQKILHDFINREIENKRSEKELEKKIREMMSNAKSISKKTTPRKTSAKKTTPRKASAKKTPARKPSAKKKKK